MTDPELRFVAEATGSQRVERGRRLQSLWSGYGEIYRVALDGEKTAIVKSVKPPHIPRSDASHARKCRSYDVELEWYRTYASRCDEGCRVPRFLAGTSAEDRWLLVLEDLDAAGYRGRALDGDACLRWLAAFHARFLGVPPQGLWKTGTYWHLATRRDELAAIDDPALRDAAPFIDGKLRAAKFQTIVHGDAKPANFCFGTLGAAAVDFQYVGGGCGMSDVAYLLGDDFDDPRRLDLYFAQLRACAAVDTRALEAEWRALLPVAAADFYRFYAGWAPSAWKRDTHAQEKLRALLRDLRVSG
ncbi:MAG: phosphotransferase [Polyangiales bacterium]